jgi:hypothetical protein
MKQPPRPAYWQLDLFVLLMSGLLLVMLAQFSPGWETVVEVVWAALTIAGMAVWVRLNWAALQREERSARMHTTHDAARRAAVQARTLPLTPVQKHFLAVMEQTDREEGAR